MRLILLLNLLVITASLSAQVTVNQQPKTGSKFALNALEYTEIDFFKQIRPTGGNQNWKLDSISILGLPDTVLYLDPKGIPAAKTIPESNLVIYDESNSLALYNFFKVDSKEMSLVGFSEDSFDLVKLDKQFLTNKFPLNHLDEFEGLTTFEVQTDLGKLKVEMESFNKVDGWGEIKTPKGTFPSLRLKSTTTLSGNLFGVPFFSVTRDEYRWISPGFDYDLFKYVVEETEFGSDLTNDTSAIYLVNQIITKNKDLSQELIKIDLSPNPCKDLLNITFPQSNNRSNYKIEIFDIESKLVYQTDLLGNSLSIPVSNWQRGAYLIKASQGQKSWGLNKVIIE